MIKCFITSGLHPAATTLFKGRGSFSVSDIRYRFFMEELASAAPPSAAGVPSWSDYANLTWDLSSFLISRCSKNFRLANYFYW